MALPQAKRYLNITPALFVRRLEGIGRKIDSGPYPSENGDHFLVVPFGAIRGNRPNQISDTGATTLSISAHLMQQGQSEPYLMREAIEIEIEPLGAERIRVGVLCWDPRLTVYFDRLLAEIDEHWPPEPRPEPEPASTEAGGPSWFPTTQKTQEIWKKAYYEAMVPMREEYAELYEEGHTDNPKPTIDDYRDRIFLVVGKMYKDDSTIYHIQKAGDSGWLK